MNFSLSHSFNVEKSNLPTVDYSIKNLTFLTKQKIIYCSVCCSVTISFISCLIYVCV